MNTQNINFLSRKWWPGRRRNERGTAEQRLWWAVLREAARDVRRGVEPDYSDAAEFLRGPTAVWLLEALFNLNIKGGVLKSAGEAKEDAGKG